MMKVNPITVEVVRNAINAYADEMATALCKSAYNMMIYEVRDFVRIDRRRRPHDLQNEGALPIFLADLGIAVKDGIARYGPRARARRRHHHEPRPGLGGAPQQRRDLRAVLP
jgi:N-methylhydantoinase B